MSRKKTQEEFKQEVYAIHGEEYSIIGIYKSLKDKVKTRHNKCGYIWDAKAQSLLDGHGCPICGITRRRKTHEQYVDEMKKVFDDEYSLIENYKNQRTKIKIKHNICGCEFKMYPDNFLKSTGCPQCSGYEEHGKKKNTEQFKKQLYDLVGDEYELIGEYVNNKTNITLKHNVCGNIYHPNPTNFLNTGRRCLYCYGNHTKTTEEFKQEVYNQRGNEYSVIGEYINSMEKIKIRHNACGYEWCVTPSDFISKQRICPLCYQSKGETEIEKFLLNKSIEYIPQKTFDGLVGLGNGLLSYDFYLPAYNLLIEYQGQFHDGSSTSKIQTKSQLKKQQEHDRRKRNYAKEHNIELMEIWYWDFDNIEQILESRLLKRSA